MSDDLVNFLRYHCDRRGIPRGVLIGIMRAADRIAELEAESALDAERLRITIERAEMAEDERNALKATLKKLEYWFDTDQEVLDAMTPDERADHMRQLQMIRDTL